MSREYGCKRLMACLLLCLVSLIQLADGFSLAPSTLSLCAGGARKICLAPMSGAAPNSCLAKMRMQSASDPKLSGEIDMARIGKWVGATGLQFATISMLLKGLDISLAAVAGVMPTGLPDLVLRVAVFLFFASMSVRSRTFSVLDNSRPARPTSKDQDWKDIEVGEGSGKKTKLMDDVQRPVCTTPCVFPSPAPPRLSYFSSGSVVFRSSHYLFPMHLGMPPPMAFPVIWSTIAVLRAISSVIGMPPPSSTLKQYSDKLKMLLWCTYLSWM